MLPILQHFMIICILYCSQVIFPYNKSTRKWTLSSFGNLWSSSQPVLKASLSHMQSCTVFNGTGFQGLHLKSTRLYKLEPFFFTSRMWIKVSDSPELLGELNEAVYIKHTDIKFGIEYVLNKPTA